MAVNAWLSVLMKSGSSVIHPRTIVRCECTGIVIRKLSFPEETVLKVVISKNEKLIDPCHIVQLDSHVVYIFY